ncbi:unnamed protein product [Chondrus crispus]|uniref:Uncharacterized protein n=1 Tax=Chondrus crispus TaxID=2769 RepID=R7QIR9_CHOCR|nr:unnamed protein product [Chondrus crispus]CDF38407.1 unnamed protein product [Chondrus crispus]|eukprot:XP_005718300.1 unnamed protein product [Chondrus crispus]
MQRRPPLENFRERKPISMHYLFHAVLVAIFFCSVHSGKRASTNGATVLVRRVIDFNTGFTTATSRDVKFVAKNQASCELSLISHADHVLSDVRDSKVLALKMLLHRGNKTRFLENLRKAEDLLRGKGCPAEAVKLSLGTSLGGFRKTYLTAYFTMNLPDMSPLPVFYGVIDKTCRVEIQKRTKRLILTNSDLFEPPSVDADPNAVSSVSIAMNFGAKGIVLDVRDDAKLNTHGLLSCTESQEISPQFIPLRSDVLVGDIRTILVSHEIGVERNRARSFMVIGFHSSDFPQ